ncbi:MAG: dihydropteroate synthase, partial [Planctomycetes bacterium]|nr:dihydropteroate synthase [Planctomycetota bacterium]
MHIPTRQGSLIYRGRPLVMGILNVTPDSFSDGGRYLDAEVAAEAALDMERQGAALIDLGACSTRPGSRPPSAEVEWSRLQPVLERIVPRLKIPVAIDTYRAQVFEAAWDLGASLLNDVTAARGDASMPDLLARTGAPAVLMHMQGEPNTMQARPHYSDVVVEVRAFFEERRRSLTASGVAPNQLIFDPGIGFGKSLEHNIELLRQVRTLVSP